MGRKRFCTEMIPHLQAYVDQLGGGCPKPSQKFLWGMLLGLVMAESVLLSEIARQVRWWRGVTFHALHKGLSRGLRSRQWAALPVQTRYLQAIAPKLTRQRVIACDLGDLTKPRARRMPGLQTVRDGSTGELKKGWWLLEIEAMTGTSQRHLPIWWELFSVSRRGYKSTWTLIEQAIRTVVRQLGCSGIWVFDRGFDSWRFWQFLGGQALWFLIRVGTKRRVTDLADGRCRSLGAVAQRVLKTAPWLWRRRYQGRAWLLRVGVQRVAIPQSGQELSVIVVEGFGRHPLLLVTNRVLHTAMEAATWAKLYLKRWGVEEAGRLVKQVFQLENIRVLSWAGLVKLVWCAMWAYGWVCLLRFRGQRLYRQLLTWYPSFGTPPPFPYYRLAGAMAILLLIAATTMPELFRRV